MFIKISLIEDQSNVDNTIQVKFTDIPKSTKQNFVRYRVTLNKL